ncbi:MAG: hypothetical protein JW969_18370 [Spirochaetales bacterium]|nr:hypothetical protein [Spirochaetales bacterium]
MEEILSQKEINSLLDAITVDTGGSKKETSGITKKKLCYYNFLRPKKLSLELETRMRAMYTGLSERIASVFAECLNLSASLYLASLDELTYGEFTASIPENAALAVVNMFPAAGKMFIEMDPVLARVIIDRYAGGKGAVMKSGHILTGIDRDILGVFFYNMVREFKSAIQPLIRLQPQLEKVTSNPEFAAASSDGEITILATCETKIGKIQGMLNFGIPYPVIQPFVSGIISSTMSSAGNEDSREQLLNRIKLKMHDFFRVKGFSIKEICQLKRGSRIPIDAANECIRKFSVAPDRRSV